MPSLIPKSSFQVRPRLAVEIRPEGVFAARANDTAGVLAQVSRVDLPAGAVQPSLRAGNIVQTATVVAALRQALGPLQQGKLRDVTVIVPDAAVRVLLLDFDSLPSNAEEALPILRFRLAKLLPFAPDAAQVSYQIMGERARQLQVLVVAIPYEVLMEYEAAVRMAGFEPGSVLPSTLAVVGAVDDGAQLAALLVNGSESSLTTAILRRGELLLHRTLDLQPASATAISAAGVSATGAVPREDPAEYGSDDPRGAEVNEGPLVREFVEASVMQDRTLAEQQRTVLEVQQAISVAAAYYEDSLAVPPEAVLTAGTISAKALGDLLLDRGMATREVLQPADMLPTVTSPLAPGLLAGLRGALRS